MPPSKQLGRKRRHWHSDRAKESVRQSVAALGGLPELRGITWHLGCRCKAQHRGKGPSCSVGHRHSLSPGPDVPEVARPSQLETAAQATWKPLLSPYGHQEKADTSRVTVPTPLHSSQCPPGIESGQTSTPSEGFGAVCRKQQLQPNLQRKSQLGEGTLSCRTPFFPGLEDWHTFLF